jgi:glycosyltransferase involved in cell wall biosynthesis
LRIAITADPELPVPPVLYGGIERIVDMLARGLVERGHAVTLFAHRDSRSVGRLAAWPGRSSVSKADTVRNAALLARHVFGGQFDLVHSFSRVAYMLPILPLSIPKLMTYQRAITRNSVVFGHRLARGSLDFSAISRFMMREVQDVGSWHVVSNGVPLATYPFRSAVAEDAPLVFLGRVEEIKGPHIAIEVARRAGVPLVIAGNIPSEHHGWFDLHIAPHVDGDLVRYIGSVDDAQKGALLGSAQAFLMPILWEEPFGIVMAEAMACGTPVIGMGRGAVPEVIEDGVTGFVVDTVDQMVAAVARASAIDRRAVRDRAERLYSDRAVVEGYIEIYDAMIARQKIRARDSAWA